MEQHNHAVGECYRCSTVVEPRVSRQWFVKMQPLAEPAIKVVQDGKLQFVPERFARIYIGWLENIRAWCISRQLSWGHGIPVWYCQDCGQRSVLKRTPPAAPNATAQSLNKTPMFWTPGFLPLSGRFPPWAGRKKQPNSSIFIQPVFWLPAGISSSSGSRA